MVKKIDEGKYEEKRKTRGSLERCPERCRGEVNVEFSMFKILLTGTR